MDDKIAKMSEVFKILSNDVRLCIVVNLCIHGEKKAGDLQFCASASQSFVSQQLSKLKDLNVITSRKVGNEVYYSIVDKDVCEIVRNMNFERSEKNG